MVFTDPFCAWCWASEPQLRRLRWEFGDGVAITFVIAGLRRRLDDGPALAADALDAAARSGMPLDARVFLRDPPGSTHPAGLAVCAVAEQHGGARAEPYLRRLREAILLEGRRRDSAAALQDAARELGPAHPLDMDRLRSDFASSAIVERFGGGLARRRARGRRRAGRRARARRRGRPAALRRDGDRRGGRGLRISASTGSHGSRRAVARGLEWRVRPRRVPGGELWEVA